MKLFTDGSCDNFLDITDRKMVIVVTDDAGAVLVEKTLSGGSSNIAELWAVTEALVWAKEAQVGEIEVLTDSRNNLAWLDGHIGKKLNDRTAVMNLLTAIDNLKKYVNMSVLWIPREENLAGMYLEGNSHS
jgi:prepilin-type processing-associated H-X9-DG protein